MEDFRVIKIKADTNFIKKYDIFVEMPLCFLTRDRDVGANGRSP